MVKALCQKALLKRPLKKDSYDSEQVYTTSTITNVKLASPSKSWFISTSGASQNLSATLFFNIGRSSAEPLLDPPFLRGDTIEVSESRSYVVQNVQEQWFKGSLHHYEVALV